MIRPLLALGALALGVSVLAPVPAHAATPCTRGEAGYVDTLQSAAVESLGLDEARAASTGAGVTVAVVDSGVAAGNAHFAGALVGGTAIGGGDPRTDPDGHGTVVAGIVAGRPVTDPATGRASVALGVAPDARIMPVQVYTTREQDRPGSLTTQKVADGIRYAADNGADVINVSISTGAADPRLDALRDAVRRAQERGVVVVASAGDLDEAQDESEQESRDQVRYPAAFPGVIGVASTNAAGATGDWGYRGPQVSVSAPGSLVVSAFFGSGDCVFGVSDDAEAPASSWSAAYVSGLAALLRERYPDESPAMTKYRIEMTASRPVATERDDDQGWGFVQPSDALGLIPDAADLGPAYPGGEAATPPVRRSEAVAQSPGIDPLVAERRRAIWFVLGGVGVAGVALVVRPLVLRRIRRRTAADGT